MKVYAIILLVLAIAILAVAILTPAKHQTYVAIVLFVTSLVCYVNRKKDDVRR